MCQEVNLLTSCWWENLPHLEYCHDIVIQMLYNDPPWHHTTIYHCVLCWCRTRWPLVLPICMVLSYYLMCTAHFVCSGQSQISTRCQYCIMYVSLTSFDYFTLALNEPSSNMFLAAKSRCIIDLLLKYTIPHAICSQYDVSYIHTHMSCWHLHTSKLMLINCGIVGELCCRYLSILPLLANSNTFAHKYKLNILYFRGL